MNLLEARIIENAIEYWTPSSDKSNKALPYRATKTQTGIAMSSKQNDVRERNPFQAVFHRLHFSELIFFSSFPYLICVRRNDHITMIGAKLSHKCKIARPYLYSTTVA